MKRLLVSVIGLVFVAGTAGFAWAQAAPSGSKMDKPAAQSEMKGKKMGMHMAAGTVKSATADSIVVSGKEKGKDAEWTFAVDDKTKVKKAGKDIMAKDIATGDTVSVRYTEHDGKMTASSVTVRAPKKQAAAQKPEKK